MKPALRLAVVPLVIAALAGAGLLWWQQRATAAGAPAPIFGNVELREVDLAFRQPGRLLRVQVEEGDRVEAGQVLAEIDTDLLADAERAAAAEVGRARAELDRLFAGNRTEDVAHAAALHEHAAAAARRAVAEYERTRQLRQPGFVSDGALEAAAATRDQAVAAAEAERLVAPAAGVVV